MLQVLHIIFKWYVLQHSVLVGTIYDLVTATALFSRPQNSFCLFSLYRVGVSLYITNLSDKQASKLYGVGVSSYITNLSDKQASKLYGVGVSSYITILSDKGASKKTKTNP